MRVRQQHIYHQQLFQDQEARALLLILKHLRQRGLYSAYDKLLEETGVKPEDPIVTDLFQTMVIGGDWSRAEEILQELRRKGIFDHYLENAPWTVVWQLLCSNGSILDHHSSTPCSRLGHAMCFDEDGQFIYLFGGWDGSDFLCDMWKYSIKNDCWQRMSDFYTNRSGHRMVYDQKSGDIYILGHLPLLDPQTGHLFVGLTEADIPISWSAGLSKSQFIRYSPQEDTYMILEESTEVGCSHNPTLR